MLLPLLPRLTPSVPRVPRKNNALADDTQCGNEGQRLQQDPESPATQPTLDSAESFTHPARQAISAGMMRWGGKGESEHSELFSTLQKKKKSKPPLIMIQLSAINLVSVLH